MKSPQNFSLVPGLANMYFLSELMKSEESIYYKGVPG